MSFNKVKSGSLIAEFIGTFGLALAVLASINGYLPQVPTPVVAGVVLGLFVLSLGSISGTHLNPAVTIGLYSVKKIDGYKATGYIISQIAGALTAVVVMNLLLDGELQSQLTVLGDYRTFFAEFLGMLFFSFGIAASVHHKYKGVDAALLVGGSLALGAFFASIASNGVINPAVAASIDSLSWSYVLGPLVGGIIGMNVYALAFGKRGKL